MRLHAISATDYIAHYDNEREAFKSRRRTREWTAPALARLGVSAPARVLFVGSGNGIEVLGLREVGYDAWGIDMRPPLPAASPWCRVGDATKPVFVDGEFDVVLALEVIEHIGGDYNGDEPMSLVRRRFASELRRVGRLIVLATPNRWFPLDEHGQNRFQIRVHSPFNDATFTIGELRELFLPREWGVIPYAGYFQLEKVKRLHIPARPIHAALRLFSNRRLHQSPFNPHLFVWFRF